MFEKRLGDLGRRELLRVVLSRESATGPEIVLEGRRYVNFSSNDYLGLANHPAITGAAIAAVEDYGFGSGASRLLAGGTLLHRELEQRIAGHKQTEAARIFNSGYAANTGMIPALSSEKDVIFSDERNHASIVDGCRLSRAQTVIYPHGDVSRLEQLMKRHRRGRKMVITDTVFSMDGDIAPLPDLVSLCRSGNALLYLDDAHGTGVIGQGKGALAHFDIAPEPWMLQMGTFSKAFGSFGAFGAGAEEIIQWVSNTARSLLFSTALPAAAAAAAVAALDLVSTTPSLVGKLWLNRRRLAEGLEALGYDTMASETPIIPVRAASVSDAVRLSRFLFEGGVYAPAIRPPTVREPRIRITVSAAHTDRQMKKLLMLMKRWREGG
jgi:8-amino-7-oxononanoate synthase